MTNSKESLGSSFVSYEQLSEPQRRAVDWQDGAFLLFAGPGSGKTAVITERVIRLLRESPSGTFRVLAMTFTNRAADEMRERIEKVVPSFESRAFVGTFHSFCTELLHQYGHELGLKSDFRIYSNDSDRQEILKQALRGLGSDARESLSNFKLLPALDRIAALLLDKSAVAERFQHAPLGEAVAAAYGAYHAELLRINAQDFSALILNCYRLMKQFPVLARQVRTVYKYWHIDEFQDTTSGQFRLLTTIADDQFSNVFAVADDDQIIYQWNGASHKRIDHFISAFSPEVLQLPTNFRCPPPVVDLANKLIANNQLRSKGKKPLVSGRPDVASDANAVELLHFESDTDEAEGVAALIDTMLPDARDAIAVIARARASLLLVKEALDELDIRSKVIQRRDAFQTEPFVWLHCALVLASRRLDEKALRETLVAFNNLVKTDITLEDVLADAKANQTDYWSTWLGAVREAVTDREWPLVEAAEKSLASNLDYRTFSDAVISWATANEISDNDADVVSPLEEDRKVWAALIRDVRSARGRAPSLDHFLQEVELRPKDPPLARGEIPLMTIHGAKGNEFDVVFVIGLAEEMLPSYQSLKKGESSPELEEERRNCFVAITRTRKRLVLSYAREYRGWKKKPSRFLREMGLLDS